MGLPGTPHVARITLGFQYSSTGIQCESVFYVQDLTDAMFADPSGFTAQVDGAALAHLLSVMSTESAFNYVGFEDVRTPPFGGVQYVYGPDAGTMAMGGDLLPSDNCLAIKKSTANLGRSGHGRWYWPIWDAGTLSGPDQVNTVYPPLIISALGAFQTAVEGGTYACEVGIVSYYTGKALRTSGLFQQILTWGITDHYVDAQRRRLLGRGR